MSDVLKTIQVKVLEYSYKVTPSEDSRDGLTLEVQANIALSAPGVDFRKSVQYLVNRVDRCYQVLRNKFMVRTALQTMACNVLHTYLEGKDELVHAVLAIPESPSATPVELQESNICTLLTSYPTNNRTYLAVEAQRMTDFWEDVSGHLTRMKEYPKFGLQSNQDFHDLLMAEATEEQPVRPSITFTDDGIKITGNVSISGTLEAGKIIYPTKV